MKSVGVVCLLVLLLFVLAPGEGACLYRSTVWFRAMEDPYDFRSLVLSDTSIDHTLLFAATFGDGLYRSDDHGKTWAAANDGIALPFYVQNALAVDPLNPAVIYAGDYYGYESGLYRSQDAGGSWSLVLTGTMGIGAVAASPATPGVVLVGDRFAGIHRSVDYGETWVVLAAAQGLTETQVGALAWAPFPPHTAYAGAAESIFTSDDGGQSWRLLATLPSTVQALAVAPGALYAGTYADGVYRSADGTTWEPMNEGLLEGAWVTSLAIHPTNPDLVYAGVWEGQVYRSEDGGGAWDSLGHLGTVYSVLLHPQAPSVIYAATSDNGLFRGSTLHHLTVSKAPGAVAVGTSFPITVTVCDELGLVRDDYNGVATLSDSTGTIAPTTIEIIAGAGQGTVTLHRAACAVSIVAETPEGLAGRSDSFTVGLLDCSSINLPIITNGVEAP